MRICIFSDTHGNIVALEAVLSDMRSRGTFDLIIMAGDLAQFGPRPAETVDRIRALGCLVLSGNTDQYIARNEPAGLEWVRTQLGAERITYLAGLPFSYSIRPEAGHELLVCHANPCDVEKPLRPDAHEDDLRPLLVGLSADVLAFGHYHVPYIRRVEPYTLFDIASDGLPRDGDVRAVYGIAERKGGHWRLEHVRVPYDLESVVADIRSSSMPNPEPAIQTLRSAHY